MADIIVDLPEDAGVTAAAPGETDVVELGDGPALPEGAEALSDGSVRLVLKHPVTLRFRNGRTGEVREGETLDHLVLHRLTGEDMRRISAARAEAMLAVSVARSARRDPVTFDKFFDRMDAADITAAGQVIDGFLGTGRKTGR